MRVDIYVCNNGYILVMLDSERKYHNFDESVPIYYKPNGFLFWLTNRFPLIRYKDWKDKVSSSDIYAIYYDVGLWINEKDEQIIRKEVEDAQRYRRECAWFDHSDPMCTADLSKFKVMWLGD